MSHYLCTMCGRAVPRSHFDPSNFELDILEVDMTGLGRGMGFVSSEPYSIMGDNDTTAKVKERALDIIAMLRENELVSDEYIAKRLGLQVGYLKDAEDEDDDEGEATNEQEVEVDQDLEDAAWGVIKRIYEVMDWDIDTIDPDEPLARTLNTAGIAMVREYADLLGSE